LAEAQLAAGSKAAALKSTRRAAALHRKHALIAPAGTTPPALIWWAHSQALRANGKAAEARAALETAYRMVVDGVANVSDDGIRRSYLCHIDTHRRIIEAWVADCAKRHAPAEQSSRH